MLRQRVLSAVVALPLVFAAVWLGGVPFSLFVGLCVLLAGREYLALAGCPGRSPLALTALLLASLFVANAHFGGPLTAEVLVATVLLLLVVRLLSAPPAGALSEWSAVLGGVLYTGWLLGFYILLRRLPGGLAWTIYALAATFAVDAAAYFVGTRLGHHRLAPRISPAKSIEGAVAGLVVGAAAGSVFAALLSVPLSVPAGLGLGLAIGVVAQLGDLVESMLKRSVQVKDASHLIPGHGGLLDRTDSLVFAGVVVYFVARWVGSA